jgi:hypothetical protein
MKFSVLTLPAMALLCLGTSTVSVAADTKTEARCAQYARRAVEQYNILASHPQCKADIPQRWQPDYATHYNACLHAPGFIAKSEEKTRDFELHACGALNLDGSVAGAPPAGNPPPDSAAPSANDSSGVTPVVGASGATPPAESVPTGTPTPGTSVAMEPPATGGADGDPCQQRNPPINMQLLGTGDPGYGWKVSGGTLTYLELHFHQSKTFHVLRPAYFLNFIKCARAPLPVTGAYVSPGSGMSGGMLFQLLDGGSVMAWPVSGDNLAKLMQGAQPSMDSGAYSPNGNPDKEVLQVGGGITTPSNNGVPCANAKPPFGSLSGGTFGINGKIAGGFLSYQELNTKKPHFYKVQRPGYYIANTSCSKETTDTGPWVYPGMGNNTGLWIILYDNGNVSAWPVPDSKMHDLLAVPSH